MKNLVSKAYRHLSLQLGKIFGDKNYRPFIVLGRSRIGTNLLNSFLNQQKQVTAHSELAGKLFGKSPEKLLDEIYCRYQNRIKAVTKIYFANPPFTGNSWQNKHICSIGKK